MAKTKAAAKQSSTHDKSAHDPTTPWEQENPKPEGKHEHLSPPAKAAAKRRAKQAGRPYPNLVDNMWASKADKDSAPAAKKPRAKPKKDPTGGLTAAGREEFARTQGAHLKPGVTKAIADMSPDEMRRKGSWATRFYGRETLPPLVKKNGEPTRFAMSAHAWGEKVPTTETQARKIAEKGRKLLERYRKLKAKK